MDQTAVVRDAFRACEKEYRKVQSLDESYLAQHYPHIHRPTSTPTHINGPTVHTIPGLSGLYVIRNAIPDEHTQAAYMAKCFTEYCAPPNDTNLHAHYDVSLLTNLWGDACRIYAQKNAAKGGIHDASKRPVIENLRWATLGMRYDWSARQYAFGANDRPLPDDLVGLCMGLAKLCLGQDYDFTPEAGIVNYYAHNSQLCGHVDDAERAMDRPIVSLSFGCSGLFLMGGRTKDVEPQAIVLHSGDAIVMHGESRLCYHGVAKIFANSMPKSLMPDAFESDSPFRKLAEFWKDMRLNVNVRQVHSDQDTS
jgi:alkylated DNA repair protein alkB family protein 1